MRTVVSFPDRKECEDERLCTLDVIHIVNASLSVFD